METNICDAICGGYKATSEELEKIIHLRDAGLIFCFHNKKDLMIQTNLDDSQEENALILTKKSNKPLRHAECIVELCQYKTKCVQCNTLIQRVRSLLEEITFIRKNDSLVKCEHCRRSSPIQVCKRCDYIVHKFLSNKVKQYQENQQRFKLWLCKVKLFLQDILEGRDICKHKVYQKTSSITELENLLLQLKTPLTVREPDIRYFPPIESRSKMETSIKTLNESKEMLEEVLAKLKSDKLKNDYLSDISNSSSETDTDCICKYFMEKKLESRRSTEVVLKEATPPETILPKPRSLSVVKYDTPADSLAEKKSDYNPSSREDPLKDETKSSSGKSKSKPKPKPKEIIPKESKEKIKKPKPDKENVIPKKKIKDTSSKETIETIKPKPVKEKQTKVKPIVEKKQIEEVKAETKEKKPKKEKPEKVQKVEEKKSEEIPPKKVEKIKETKSEDTPPKKPGISPEELLLLKLIKQESEKKRIDKKEKEEKPKPMRKISDLPVPKRRMKSTVEKEISESIVECKDQGAVRPTEMIKGTCILPISNYRYREDDESDSDKPLIYKVNPECPTPIVRTPSPTSVISTESQIKEGKTKIEKPKGVLSYALSNPEFIEKGWTLLPTTKIMRRMNIYKMVPATPEYDWFIRHKDERIMYYDTGEKLAEIDDDGCGRWYYKNGKIALDYYNAKELNAGHRYIVYSSGQSDIYNKECPITVLASFDFLGNGVVYDSYGNVRIKYNQSEGMLFDEKIGPRGKWKWHTLNDPPVLQPVFIDTNLGSRDSCIEELIRRQKEELPYSRSDNRNEEMLAIELDNFLREKADKLLQKYKSFQIRMKVVKINRQMSLRILDQANIYLLFRDGQRSLKLNLGMLLISNEIVDTTMADVAEVPTTYDRHPARSQSVANIQKILSRTKKSRMHTAIN